MKEKSYCWVLVAQPIILATQEAEIRKIKDGNQPGQIVCETLSQKKIHHKKKLVEWLKV
jgi:hypothetical protein